MIQANKARRGGQDFADGVAAGAKHGEDGIAGCAFQRTAGQAAIGFQMTDLSLDAASATQVGDQSLRQAAAHSADRNAGACFAMAAITAVDDGKVGAVAMVASEMSTPGASRSATSLKPCGVR
jgi:hypothetical protein